jgi:hypothetical protein
VSLSPGDPASASALGGTLRTQAGRLADLAIDLERASRLAERAGRADASRDERDLLSRAAAELDRVGALLQGWTTTAVDTAARVRAMEPELTHHDLGVEGHLVVELAGPSRVEPAARLAARERLQELLNRASAARSRELARLGREFEQSAAALAALSDRARSGR